MGWSESYYNDMSGEARGEIARKADDLLGALRELRAAFDTYGGFIPEWGDLEGLLDDLESRLDDLRGPA